MSIAPHDDHGKQRPPSQPPSPTASAILAEVRELRAECRALRRVFDEFARVYLNARFPYGKPTDRWRPRG